MIYPPVQYEEYKDGIYSMKTFDENLDLIHIFRKYKNENSDIVFASDSTYAEDQYDIFIDENGV